jgi:hypothetical protein
MSSKIENVRSFKMERAKLSIATVMALIIAFRGRWKGGSVKRLLLDRKNDRINECIKES